MRQTVRLQKATERLAAQKAREVAYLREQMRGPLDGLEYALRKLAEKLPEKAALPAGRGKQGVWVRTATAMLRQMRAVLADSDMALLEQGYMEFQVSTFSMETVMSSVVAQATMAANLTNSKVTSEIAAELRSLPLSGDPERLQQALAGFATIAARFTPSAGLVKIEASLKGTRALRAASSFAQLEIRISHTGQGVPPELLTQMLDESKSKKSQEGLVLHLERLILKAMDGGEVVYERDGSRPCFVVSVDMALAANARRVGLF